MDVIPGLIETYLKAPFDLYTRFGVVYLASTVLLAYAIWRTRGQNGSFTRWLLPKQIYTHRSNLVDLSLFLTNLTLKGLGILGALVLTPVAALHTLDLIAALFGHSVEPKPVTGARIFAVTAIVVLLNDFLKYWVHRVHHENMVLWPFHAVHHSADVLTPVTVARIHPMENVVRILITGSLIGVAQGLMLYFLIGRIELVTLGGANAVYVLFNALGANLRHSHIWVSYGRRLEHILISPAQHQIHHSAARRHFNKNYGSIFALWDWMFGTLYIPDSYEELRFGVAGADGTPIDQPHPTLWAALAHPFAESWHWIRTRITQKRRATLRKSAK